MKLKFKQYNSRWPRDFDIVKDEIIERIGFLNPRIAHIGSTAVHGLAAKPIIDILVGLEQECDLDRCIQPMINGNFIYYPIFNKVMPYRRFFVKHKASFDTFLISSVIDSEDKKPTSSEEHDHRLAHVHILPIHSEHWTRHIAFRDYLREFPDIKLQYQNLKTQLISKEWRDGNAYNDAKNLFIKEHERKAVIWYKTNQHK